MKKKKTVFFFFFFYCTNKNSLQGKRHYAKFHPELMFRFKIIKPRKNAGTTNRPLKLVVSVNDVRLCKC